ncbi:hypothetical protein PP175_26620 (plasmid) [Aneurinibacillus sp. Ricciae_BoGa-3]|uniref:hypothetical protein n=1 Tax=Aneurinibacillus sp. Ricciae_BoGa-3 TaxID=3022697 RepID=UPI002340CB6C|nr:hypothetical protein [Aneurinibacillus sp. Ricciae_BoGa-3]WCK57636.1 hypothetical protein PP175_26620 [Aneurinibacillus sp. Ricciae_BoGa-3]
MSRSYKKQPIIKDHDSGKAGKNFANRKVRRYKQALPNGKAYRKIYETYDVHDYVSRYSYENFQHDKEAEEKQVQNGTRNYRFCLSEHDWAKYYKWK